MASCGSVGGGASTGGGDISSAASVDGMGSEGDVSGVGGHVSDLGVLEEVTNPVMRNFSSRFEEGGWASSNDRL